MNCNEAKSIVSKISGIPYRFLESWKSLSGQFFVRRPIFYDEFYVILQDGRIKHYCKGEYRDVHVLD